MADTDPDRSSLRTEIERLDDARELERLHRALQQQGEERSRDVPPRERERHEAIDAAAEDAERSVRHAAERRRAEAQARTF